MKLIWADAFCMVSVLKFYNPQPQDQFGDSNQYATACPIRINNKTFAFHLKIVNNIKLRFESVEIFTVLRFFFTIFISGSKGGRQGRAPPISPNLFNFMQFLGKIGKNNRLVPPPLQLVHPLWEILDPSLILFYHLLLSSFQSIISCDPCDEVFKLWNLKSTLRKDWTALTRIFHLILCQWYGLILLKCSHMDLPWFYLNFLCPI